MSFRRILGIILLLAGLTSVGFSIYIKREVAKGKEQIASGQQKVDQGKALFGLSPATKPIGEGVAAPVQGRIDQGRRDVAYYEMVSNYLLYGGILAIVFGALLLFLPRKSV